MPGAMKGAMSKIVEDLVFALPPIITLTITASVAEKLRQALTAVIVEAISTFLNSQQPEAPRAAPPRPAPPHCDSSVRRRPAQLVSNLKHALVHGLHNSLTQSVVHATALPLTHALSSSLTTSLVHYYYCTYCYYYHDYCRYCHGYETYHEMHRNYWQGNFKPDESTSNYGADWYGNSRAAGRLIG
jgi:hypothetical protein